MAPNGCVGSCCRLFMLPGTPAEIQASAENARSESAGQPVKYPGAPRWREIERIAELVIPVVFVEAGEPSPILGESLSMGTWFYTCRAYDEETGLCREYDARPSMCRDYPYGSPCDHGGCAYAPPVVEWHALDEAVGRAT